MKKLIALTLMAGLLTSCGDGLKDSCEPSPEAIGELTTLYSHPMQTRLSAKRYEITEYMIYMGSYVKATTTDGETIITSTWTIKLY
jgi:hypothetical protein